ERILESVEALACGFIARSWDPAIRLQQNGRSEVALAVPPVARARGLAAEAQDALVKPVELGAILAALLPLGCGLRRNSLEPGLNRRQLRSEERRVGQE